MTKAWLACILLCGMSLQANATENNNHATHVKELLKPAPFDNVLYSQNESSKIVPSTGQISQDAQQQSEASFVDSKLVPKLSLEALNKLTAAQVYALSQNIVPKTNSDAADIANFVHGEQLSQDSEEATLGILPQLDTMLDLDPEQTVFNQLTSMQSAKLVANIGDIFKALDKSDFKKIKKQFNLKSGQEHNFDHAQIIPILQALAELPNATALTYLGDLYKHGNGILQDQNKAFACYEQAASLGDSIAMNKLGECFSYGVGCESSLETAAKWYKAAADKGNVEAQFNLGYVYEFGEGVPLDSDKARYWYEKAAAQHHADSMFFLGQMYLDGDGVPFDETIAKDYFGRACDLGSTDGCDLYQVLLSSNK